MCGEFVPSTARRFNTTVASTDIMFRLAQLGERTSERDIEHDDLISPNWHPGWLRRR